MPPVPGDAASPPARSSRAGGWLLLVAAAYVAALWWLDRDKHILGQLAALRLPLALATVPVLLSFGLRYQRWRRLLRSQGDAVPWGRGALAYLSGFAFTASPGKAGELLRIRYYARMQVPPSRTFAAFLFERALDLVVVTALGAGAAMLIPAFGWLAALVCTAVALLLVAATWDRPRRFLHRHAGRLPGAGPRRLLAFLLAGLGALRPLVRARTLAEGSAWGLGAWLLTSLAFVGLCMAMGLALPWHAALGIYPLAMLVGALSFVPGGVGTTEAAIVLMLRRFDIELDQAVAAAIAIRLVTLWFAVLVGMLAMASLERSPARRPAL